MPRPTKLTDIQLILLSTASARADGQFFPIADTLNAEDGRLGKSLSALISKGLAAETEVQKSGQTWRQEEDRRIGVIITESGCAAIAADPSEGEAAAPESGAPAPRAKRDAKPGVKQAQLVEMLARDRGASIAEITAATSWLPHSARAMLTGLRKRGFSIESEKVDGVRRYRTDCIEPAQ